MKKENRFIIAVSLSIFSAFVLAVGHVFFGIHLLGIEDFKILDMYVFFLSTAIVTFVGISYLAYFRDITETLAVLIAGIWALFFGLEDLICYLFLMKPLPSNLTWLGGSLAGFLPYILGVPVTPLMLVLNVLFSGLIAFTLIGLLYEYEKKFGPFEI